MPGGYPEQRAVRAPAGDVRSRHRSSSTRLRSLEPHVRREGGRLGHSVIGPRPLNPPRVERICELVQRRVTEASADLADGLVLLVLLVVARQQEGSVDAGAFALAEVGANGDQVA